MNSWVVGAEALLHGSEPVTIVAIGRWDDLTYWADLQGRGFRVRRPISDITRKET